MTVSRLQGIVGIGVEKMGDAADAAVDRAMLRLENLDTDLRPPKDAVDATLAAVTRDEANSYLPFHGTDALREAATARVSSDTGLTLEWRRQCVISAGGLSGILNALLAMLEPGDEVIITDPAYVGLLNRIRLAGGVPRLVPLRVVDGRWRLDLDQLVEAGKGNPRVVLTMSPSMPSGIVHSDEEWDAIVEIIERTGAWLLHDASMERIVYSRPAPGRAGRPFGFPFTSVADRAVIVGCVSKEYRMIGWRVGWVVGPPDLIDDIGLVSLSNVVCQVGIAMPGAAAALVAKNDGVLEAVAEWGARRDLIMAELSDLPVVLPDGGWSILIDTEALGMKPADASRLLFEKAQIAATPMINWGDPDQAGRYLRFVFSNEPRDRLSGIRERLRTAWSV